MKKSSLVWQSLIGIQMGLILSSYNGQNGQGEMSPEVKTFYEQLNPDAKKKFEQLDDEHKKKAMRIVEHHCHSVHECKGYREQYVEEQYQHQMQQRQKLQDR